MAIEVLRQLGFLTPTALHTLETLGFSPRLPVKNWRGLVAGEMRPCFRLQSERLKLIA
jgi:hypothetical protein